MAQPNSKVVQVRVWVLFGSLLLRRFNILLSLQTFAYNNFTYWNFNIFCYISYSATTSLVYFAVSIALLQYLYYILLYQLFCHNIFSILCSISCSALVSLLHFVVLVVLLQYLYHFCGTNCSTVASLLYLPYQLFH